MKSLVISDKPAIFAVSKGTNPETARATNPLNTFSVMKTLNETINEVMTSNKSLNTKVKELKALGLTDWDVANIKKQYVDALGTTRTRVVPFAYTFGVEIECLCNRSNVERGLTDNGVAYNWVGSYYHTNGNSVFEFKRDGSLSSDRYTAAGNHPIEMVSPVLSSEGGLARLQTACGVLNATGAQVNKSCGLHVHISCADFTDEQFVNCFKNYQRLESLIDSWMAPSRRGNENTYCKSVARFNFDRCYTPTDVQYEMGNNRYYKLNAMSWGMHHTIEFRQHHGSTNYSKISHWVKFCAALVGWSKTHVLDHVVTDINDVPFLTAAEKRWFKTRIDELA